MADIHNLFNNRKNKTKQKKPKKTQKTKKGAQTNKQKKNYAYKIYMGFGGPFVFEAIVRMPLSVSLFFSLSLFSLLFLSLPHSAHPSNEIQDRLKCFYPKEKKKNMPSPKSGGAWRGMNGEDLMLRDFFFPGETRGTYVEVGSFDGVQGSVSFGFEYELGWTGVLIDVNRWRSRLAINNRPSSVSCNFAICDNYMPLSPDDHHLLPNDNETNAYFAPYYNYHNPAEEDQEVEEEQKNFLKNENFESQCLNGYVNYHMGGLTGGLAETLDSNVLKKKWRTFHERKSSFWCLKCSSLMEVLGIAGGHMEFDFFVLDVTGGELEAIRTIDWNVFSAKIIIIQAYSSEIRNKRVQQRLTSNGYYFLGEHRTNYYFVYRKWSKSREIQRKCEKSQQFSNNKIKIDF